MKRVLDLLWPAREQDALEAALLPGSREVEEREVWGHNLESRLRQAAPAMILVNGAWLGLLDVGAKHAVLLAPDLRRVRVPFQDLCDVIRSGPEAPYRAEVERVLADCGIPERRRDCVRREMLAVRTRLLVMARFRTIRTPPGASFAQQASGAGLGWRIAGLSGAHLLEDLLWIVSWWLLGRDALQGRLDPGWIAAWALLLACVIPARLATVWLQGSAAIRMGGLLRQRMLAGALLLHPEEVRHEGAGRFLARGIEAAQVENLALSGAIPAALALIELVVALAVLLFGAAPLLHVLLLLLFTAAVFGVAARYYRARLKWTDSRLAMTHDLVEQMTGHRTRLAQQRPEQWHEREDQAASEYLDLSQRMDSRGSVLIGLAPRAWLFIGIALLAPAFLAQGANPAALAISLGGLLFAWQAFRRLTAGLANLAGAGIAWKQVAPLFHAAARFEPQRPTPAAPETDTVLTATDLRFRYSERTPPVLTGANLDVKRGDWVLLEGESGGGKSTLVSLLTGLRPPECGLLLIRGLDQQTLGAREWRKHIAAAPQYHENHVLTGTFAYNLLMGRSWPASDDVMREAEQLCRELGLGPLLERMPGGMMQMVGETGWQLSQGERSRLFLARALLQKADLVVLDESFAALDPATLRLSLECVLRRAPSLIVVAHP